MKTGKLILSIFKWIFITILFLILFLVILLSLDSDYYEINLSEIEKSELPIVLDYKPVDDDMLFDSLLKVYGKNKVLAEGFEIQCLLALSHFPELKDAKIDFLVEPAFLPLSSRPDPKSILFPWIDRKYLVVISNKSTDYFEPILLHHVPFNSQVGIIGHELAHTLYYLDKNAFSIAQIALNYQFDNQYRIRFERSADKLAIAHGLGHQLYDFAYFVRRAFGDSDKEIEEEKGGMYLSPNEIAAEMKKYRFYKEYP